ncbi:MAG TPA: hypothetical protein VFA99_10275 [Acidobacteriaceae bacterium]|nr:hypothetical protein [Acidobacteriaceae bacterium]
MSRIDLRPIVAAVSVCLVLALHAQEQYPPPLKHTAEDHPAEHIILLNVEGLHALDLDTYVAAHPHSAIAELSTRAVIYSNAHLAWNTEAAGVLALVTGGTPLSTGVYTAGQTCTLQSPRVNSIFDLVHARGERTAWAGSAAEIRLLEGHTHNALTDTVPTHTAAETMQMLARWMSSPDPPQIAGATFQEFAAAQVATNAYAPLGEMSPALETTLDRFDKELAKLVGTLQSSALYDRTWIVLTAASTSGPPVQLSSGATDTSRLRLAIRRVAPHACVWIDGLAHIWLRDDAEIQRLASALAAQRHSLGIGDILTPARLRLRLASPEPDERRPALVLVPSTGIRWISSSSGMPARSEDQNANVALVISGAQFRDRRDPTPVPTTQTAALLVRALGMEKLDLKALHREHSPALPGIF